MNNTIARSVYETAARIRNPTLEGARRRLEASEFASLRSLEDIQAERLRAFLLFVDRWSPYYRTLFRDVGLDPSKVTSPSDLKAIPVIDKAKLVENNASVHTTFPFRRVFRAETSGTSGVALDFYKDEEWDSAVRAHLMRSYARFGVHPADRNGYLWGYNLKPSQVRRVRMLDQLQNRFRLFSLDRNSIERFAEMLRGAVYLGGYSSMIFEVAKAFNRLGIEAPQLRLVKGTSEMILDVYQAEALKAFGTKIVSEYGAAEAGLIAFECERGSLHVNIEDLVLESETDGSILVTNLVSKSFPIIRYRLGDVVSLNASQCSCGRSHPVISEIQGRRGAVLRGQEQTYPALTFYYVFKNIALETGVLLNYRARQTEVGRVVVEIEGQHNSIHCRLVGEQLARYFQKDVEAELRFVDSLEREKRKAQYFETTLG